MRFSTKQIFYLMKKNYPLTSTSRRSKVRLQFALPLLFLVLTSVTSFAQVINYGFSQNQETYIPLDEAIVLATPTALTGTGSIDDQVYSLEEGTIPFIFKFNNIDYTSLKVHANGFVSFGTSSGSTSSPISDSTYPGVITAMGDDLHALYQLNGLTGNISYKTIGTAPNREFVIQWSHFRSYVSSSSIQSYSDWNFQIHLKENNTITMVYDLNVTGTPTSTTVEVGLKGASDSDYNNRMSGGTSSSNWSNSSAGNSLYSSMTMNSTSLPSSGLTFIWTPPSACTIPTTQPSALNFTYNGSTASGTFTAATADSYLIVRTQNGTIADAPLNGTVYTTGTGLNGTIIAITNSTSFTTSMLGNTAYTYTIFAVNRTCTGGPLYNIINPLTSDIISCPSPPTAVTAGNPGLDTFELNWIAPANGEAAEFHYSVEISTSADFNAQIPDSPFTVDPGETNLYVTGLESATKYYSRINSINSCSGAYSNISSISTNCLALTTLPYTENFNEATLPSCWSTGLLTGTNNWSPASSNDGVPSAYSGTYFASKTYNNSNALLISPEFDMSAQTAALRIKVWIYRNATKGHVSDVVKFHVSKTNTLTDATELLSVGLKITQTPVVATGGWYQYTAILPSSYTTEPFYIIAQGITAGSSSSYGIGFDDFTLEEVPVDSAPVSVQISTLNNIEAVINVNEGTLQLQAGITPATANQNVIWSIIDITGTATISTTGLVKAVTDGTVTVKAVSVEDSTISGEFTVIISNQFAVESIEVSTLNNALPVITENTGTLQLQATTLPTGSNQAVTWSIINGTGQATISATGLISALANGEVTAKAVSVSDPSISALLTITITNQLTAICTPTFGEDSVEAITLVEFGGFSNTSSASSDVEYENFTNITGTIEQGTTASIRVKGNSNGNFANFYTVYFDWNNNRVFEDNERTDLGKITGSTGEDALELTANIAIPLTAYIGDIRMRVLKKYSGATSLSIPACNTSGYGQAEDYTITVTEANLGTGEFNKTKFILYPNPTTGKVNINTQTEISSISIYNQLGQQLSKTTSQQIDLSSQPSGIYIIHLGFADGKTAISKIIKQ